MQRLMECEHVLGNEIADGYLRGALSAADQEAFEDHYFECARCFGELENLSLLGQAVARGAADVEARFRTGDRRARWTWVAAAVVAFVAIGLYWFVRSNGPPERRADGEGRVAQQQRAARVQPAPEAPSRPLPEIASPAQSRHPPAVPVSAGAKVRSAALAVLAVVQAPPYTPAILRGALDEPERRFREAMRLYVNRDYAGAKPELRVAAALDRERPDIAFFLGICALLTDESVTATTELRRTIALGESPYLEEAHFYLAKSHLRRGELSAAAAQLKATVRLRGEREKEAREMLKKLEVFRRTAP
jgi:TolA-binding protein